MGVAERSMGLGLRALNSLAGTDAVDRLGLREPAQRLVSRSARGSLKAAGSARRTFSAVAKLGGPRRPGEARSRGEFDLTPTDEQLLLRDAFRDFGRDELRPRAQDADAACAAPRALLDQAAGLGLTTLGVPEALGGVVSERSAVTTVLVAEALAHGDMGLAAAILAPAGVATALGLWGDADQQATYLPPFVSDDVPTAALAMLEPRPLFDPVALQTRARRRAGGGFVLDGVKALVPSAVDAELLLVAASLEGRGPALFLVEAGEPGVTAEPEPAMGVRAAATGRLVLAGVRLPERALLAGADPAVYLECVRRARLAWCALAVGCGQAVLDHVTVYVNERRAFGEPISHRQAVAFAVADMAVELEGMRLLTWRAAALADQGRPFDHATALARRSCATRGMAIGNQGVQLLGGHGYVKEYPQERWFRDLRACGVMEGGLLV